jgi:hypothetical protein
MPNLLDRVRQRLRRPAASFSVEYTSLVLLVALAYLALFAQTGANVPN